MSKGVVAVGAALALLVGCAGTEGGNPVAAQLALSAYSSDPVRVGIAVDGDVVRIDDGWIVVRDLKLERAARCDTGTSEKVVLAGPRVARLVRMPEIETFDADPEPYCRLTLKVDDTSDVELGDAPAELAQHSLLLRGQLAGGEPLLLRSRQKLDVELRSRTEPFLVDRDRPGLVLGLDLASLLATLDLDGADVEPDGTVWIDADHNRDLLDAFDRALEAAMKLFRDGDVDGVVSDAERASPLAE